MASNARFAEVASLAGDPARAAMLHALMDGRALTATELAHAASVTPQTASGHLARMATAGLLGLEKQGRHRYFRLASPKVVDMLDAIVAIALETRPRYRPLSHNAQERSAARICYVHLAGRLAVDLTDALTARKYIVLGDDGAEITPAGTRFLVEFGIDLSALSSARPPILQSLHRLDGTTPAHRGAGRGGAYETLLRPQLDRTDEG